MFHVVAYYDPSLATSLTTLTPLQDVFFGGGTGGTPDGGFLMPRDMNLIAAFACSQNILGARVASPSSLRLAYPSIRPVQQNAGYLPPTDPNLQVLLGKPVRFPGGERVKVEAVTTTGTEPGVVLLWFSDGIEPVPAGEEFTVRFTKVAGATVAMTPNTWTTVVPQFDQSLPSGTYMVTGLEYWSQTAIAARLACPGSYYRPGVLAINGPYISSGRTHDLFYGDSLGVYGTFATDVPPMLDVLCGAADTDFEGTMRLIRVGTAR